METVGNITSTWTVSETFFKDLLLPGNNPHSAATLSLDWHRDHVRPNQLMFDFQSGETSIVVVSAAFGTHEMYR